MNPRSHTRQDASRWVGTVLASRFRVDGVLGEGGMGLVLAAHHLALGQPVAVKVSHEPDDTIARERFLREARLAARLRSEHAARVLDAGTLDTGEVYLVMERLEGCTLKAHLARGGAMPVTEAVDHVIQACDAVAEAHSLGIVHRDIKPSNLFLTRRADGSSLVKVLDFGIAKEIASLGEADLTGTADVLGSPHYLSPEQLRGARRVTPRSDVWALGVVLYELLSGQRPFRGQTLPELFMAIGTEPEPALRDLRPGLPADLVALIHRCLSKDPALRPASVAALVEPLSAFAPLAHVRLIVDRIGLLPDAPLSSSDSLVAVPSSTDSLESTVTSADGAPSRPRTDLPVVSPAPPAVLPGAPLSAPPPARRRAALWALPLALLGALVALRLRASPAPAALPPSGAGAAIAPARSLDPARVVAGETIVDPARVVAGETIGARAMPVAPATGADVVPSASASAPLPARAVRARPADPPRVGPRSPGGGQPDDGPATPGGESLFLPSLRK